jgi:hypothetical protein
VTLVASFTSLRCCCCCWLAAPCATKPPAVMTPATVLLSVAGLAAAAAAAAAEKPVLLLCRRLMRYRSPLLSSTASKRSVATPACSNKHQNIRSQELGDHWQQALPCYIESECELRIFAAAFGLTVEPRRGGSIRPPCTSRIV